MQLDPIENPLRFLEIYTESLLPSDVHSLWMLYALAFAVRDVEGH
jgi:hypothetical protein